MDYKVVIETFEGPLDLLLHLIEKAKVDIYDIPIKEITNQYIEYIKNMQELDLEVTSEFLTMASTLLEIKSKMLLPSYKDEDSECQQLEMEEVDPRLELVERLVEYKKYKMAADKLRDKETIQKKVFTKLKEEIVAEEDCELPLEGLDLSKLVESLNNVLKKINNKYKAVDIDEIQRDEITLEESIDRIMRMLDNHSKINFSKLFDENSTRSEIVVSFLSVLELIKMKYITVRQEVNFTDIIIIKK